MITRTALTRVSTMAAFFLPLAGWEAHAADRHVPADYPTIQAAVDAAALFDVVVVAEGVYPGSVTIKKDFVGVRGKGDVIINNGAGVEIDSAFGVLLENLTVIHGGVYAVTVRESTDVTIRKCEVKAVGFGVAFIKGSKIRLIDSEVTVNSSSSDAVGVVDTTDAEIVGCKIRGGEFGVQAEGASRLVIRDCDVRDALTGISAYSDLEITAITENKIGDVNLGIYVSTPGLIARNDVSFAEVGVWIRGDRSRVMGNALADVQETGFLVEGDDVVVASNKLARCGSGVVVANGSLRTMVVGNQIKKSAQQGIRFEGSDGLVAYSKISKSGGSDFNMDAAPEKPRLLDNKFKTKQ